MKIQNIPKINPIVEMTSPILLQCRSGECGNCPNGTGKLLWIPPGNTFNFYLQYNFFDKSGEGTGDVKFNFVTADGTQNGLPMNYSNPPNKNYSDTVEVSESPTFPMSLMRGTDFIESQFSFNANGWVYFKQQNPAISNVHDALCFEYNHEKRLITFRSF